MRVDIQADAPWRLITIPVSHYCEKARWALDRLQIPYVEEPHILPFHRKVTERLGGTTVPVLVADTQILTDSTEILAYIDALAPADAKLYPHDPAQRQTGQALEMLFNQTLGPATRLWGYFHLLTREDLLHQSWCQGIPEREQTLYSKMLPRMKQMVQDALDISEVSAAHALKTIERVFAMVDDRLSDGRPYLLGDSMTAADLTFAALAAPIIDPPEHPMQFSRTISLPDDMTREILACRRTEAGQFVLRLYLNRV